MSNLISVRWRMNEIVQLSQDFTRIVDACCEHRPWFNDYLWENAVERRIAVVTYLREAAQEGVLWVVYHGANPMGIVLLNEVQVHVDAKAHFVFFDHKLMDKTGVCNSMLEWSFEQLDLHRISVEVPTYAAALASFLRKRLGFRYETEGRTVEWPRELKRHKQSDTLAQFIRRNTTVISAWASRKYQAVLYKGEWHDVLLLSLTREEFAHAGTTAQARGSGAEAVRAGVLDGGSSVRPKKGNGGEDVPPGVRGGELHSSPARTDEGRDRSPFGDPE